MTLPVGHQAKLLTAVAKAVAAAGGRLVVVVVSAGGVDLDESLVDAVLWQPYGGQEAGTGLAYAGFATSCNLFLWPSCGTLAAAATPCRRVIYTAWPELHPFFAWRAVCSPHMQQCGAFR